MAKRDSGPDWKYCECGCHGHEVKILNQWFWILNDLKGHYYLHLGHGWTSPKLSTHNSFGDASDAAIAYAKKHVPDVGYIPS